MLGHLFDGNPVDEGTKRRGLTPSCIVGKARKFHIQIDKWLVMEYYAVITNDMSAILS